MLNSLTGVECGELVTETYLDSRFSASLVLLQCKSCFESMRQKCFVALRFMAELKDGYSDTLVAKKSQLLLVFTNLICCVGKLHKILKQTTKQFFVIINAELNKCSPLFLGESHSAV